MREPNRGPGSGPNSRPAGKAVTRAGRTAPTNRAGGNENTGGSNGNLYGVSEQSRRVTGRTNRGRAAVRNRKRRRRLLFFYMSMFLLVLCAALILAVTVLFKVETIEVKGNGRYTAEEIREASRLQQGDNLLLTDTGAAGEAIETALPYVKRAEIDCRLPDCFVITVEEDYVAAAFAYQEQYLLTGSSGKALEVSTEKPPDCPLIKGVQVKSAELGKEITFEDEDVFEIFTQLMQTIGESGLDRITEIDLNYLYKIQILYDDRITVNLGMPTDFDYKLRVILKQSLLDGGKLTEEDRGTLDLSLVKENGKSYFLPQGSDVSVGYEGDASSGEPVSSDDASSSEPSG